VADLSEFGGSLYRISMRDHLTTSLQAIEGQAVERAAGLVNRWCQAWNAHDMDALAALVTDDVAFVTVSGNRLLGREEFRRHHQNIHQDQMRESTWQTLAWEWRHLPAALLLVHVEWTIDGDRDPDGAPRPRRFGLFTWLLALTNENCSILAAHNTDLRPGIGHRSERAIRARLEIEGIQP
jgi:uncharacterized protein (TIGR02246 family)